MNVGELCYGELQMKGVEPLQIIFSLQLKKISLLWGIYERWKAVEQLAGVMMLIKGPKQFSVRFDLEPILSSTRKK
jgi:hypothetical protein